MPPCPQSARRVVESSHRRATVAGGRRAAAFLSHDSAVEKENASRAGSKTDVVPLFRFLRSNAGSTFGFARIIVTKFWQQRPTAFVRCVRGDRAPIRFGGGGGRAGLVYFERRRRRFTRIANVRRDRFAVCARVVCRVARA